MNGWRTGGVDVGDMTMLDGEFEGRLGHGWARGRLKTGDILVAIRHSGDSFFNYLLVNHSKTLVDGVEKLRLEPVNAHIGAYTLGTPIGTLSAEVVAALMSGESMTVDMPRMPDAARPGPVMELSDHVVRQAMEYAPDFANEGGIQRHHDWRDHVGESVASIWHALPRDVRLAIAADADHRAGLDDHE